MDPVTILAIAAFVGAGAFSGMLAWTSRRAKAAPESAKAMLDPRVAELTADVRTLRARVEQLELERPRFVAEMNGLLEQTQDTLERLDAKRRSIDTKEQRAAERAARKEDAQQPALPGESVDRKAEARSYFGSRRLQ